MHVPAGCRRVAVKAVPYNDKRLRRLQDYLRERVVVLGLDLAASRENTRRAVLEALIRQVEGLQVWMATNLPANREEE